MLVLNIQDVNIDNNISMPIVHFHEHYEFYFLLSGTRNIFIRNEVFLAKPNTLCIIPPYCIHRTEGKNYKRINLNISEDFLDENEKTFLQQHFHRSPTFILSDEQQKFIVALLENAAKIKEDSEDAQQRRLLPFAKTILYYLQTLDLTPLNPINPTASHKNSSDTISNILKYLHESHQEHITLHSLCEKFFISPNTLCKNFHDHTGYSIMEYLSFIRLEKVKIFLLSSKKNMEEIATLCGFSSANYMGTIFKKHFGLSPLNYRKKISNRKT